MLITSPLLTDQYELVMAHGYWQLGMAEKRSVFQLTLRSHPFNGNYTIASGLNRVIDFLSHWKFNETDLSYISQLKSSGQLPLFPDAFINYLKHLRFSCDIEAIPEGTVVFPKEPLLRIEGPILQCQLLETALMNLIQFPSLVATNASRLYFASDKGEIVEFGLRRAQGPDGGITASRAAYIGGCAGTSNLLAGKTYNLPTFGTQAHSWIMAFDNEITAFEQFAQTQPDNVILLIDTYHTREGIENAIKVGHSLKKQKIPLKAVRLDSGDLLTLSQYVRSRLDSEGFQNTKIMASGDLNETKIRALKKANAPIDIWGVGTHLSASTDSPYLNIAYKLAAVEDEKQNWQYKQKISDTAAKTSLPGIHQVRRHFEQEYPVRDIIYDKYTTPLAIDAHANDLLQPIFKAGHLVYSPLDVHEIRKTCIRQVELFREKFNDDQTYPVNT